MSLRTDWIEAVHDRAADLGMQAVGLASILMSYANADTGELWPSRSTLADRFGVSESTIKRALVALRDAGLLERPESGRQTQMRLVLPGPHMTRPPVHIRPDPGPHMTRKPYTRTTEENLKEGSAEITLRAKVAAMDGRTRFPKDQNQTGGRMEDREDSKLSARPDQPIPPDSAAPPLSNGTDLQSEIMSMLVDIYGEAKASPGTGAQIAVAILGPAKAAFGDTDEARAKALAYVRERLIEMSLRDNPPSVRSAVTWIQRDVRDWMTTEKMREPEGGDATNLATPDHELFKPSDHGRSQLEEMAHDEVWNYYRENPNRARAEAIFHEHYRTERKTEWAKERWDHLVKRYGIFGLTEPGSRASETRRQTTTGEELGRELERIGRIVINNR